MVLIFGPMSNTQKICGVYAIRCGERSYVGSSAEMETRWKRHKSRLRAGKHKNPHLQNAWNKYGEDAFEFVILEECEPALLIEREQYWIDQHPVRYNLLPASGSRLGIPHSPEVRAKIAESHRSNPRRWSPEARARVAEANRKRVVSDGQRAKTSAALKGRKASPEAIANQRKAQQIRRNRERLAATDGDASNVSPTLELQTKPTSN
jgi:group I intron endonuclease